MIGERIQRVKEKLRDGGHMEKGKRFSQNSGVAMAHWYALGGPNANAKGSFFFFFGTPASIAGTLFFFFFF